MDLGLDGKRAIVTGGSRGIGKAVARTLAAEGCDVVIAARGEGPLADAAAELAEVTADLFWADMNVKVLGYLRCAQAVAPHMAANRWGRIVNISGLGARTTGAVIGSMRNVAVAALAKNLADELGPSGINVTVVHPGLTRTERTAGLVQAQARSQNVSEQDIEKRMAEGNSIKHLVDAAEVAD